MINAQEVFKKCSPSFRLYLSANLHIKKALLNIVHNKIKDPQVKPIPDDPADLYLFLQNSQNKIQKSSCLKTKQKTILLPTNCQSVDSASLDITLIRYLIQTFCGIKNAKNDWKEPAPSDHSLCAYVYRAADFRNQICHNNDVDKLDETIFEKKWKELKAILQGLKYTVDIEPFRTETLDLKKHEHVIFEEFVGHLQSYKEECKKEPTQDDYIKRRFYVDKDKSIVNESDVESLIEENDCLMIYGEAGMGKSSTARRIKNKWSDEIILKKFNLVYFDSKKINKRLEVDSNAAPLYFSDLRDHLKNNGSTDDDLSIYSCVKKTIEKLIILIDGIDEFPVNDLLNTKTYVDELERKVMNNEKINATDTIIAIYFGFLLPNTKICVLGRNNEFERLKEFLSRNKKRKIKDLKLLKFDEANVKDFTCNKICDRQQNEQTMCTGACQKIYEGIKNIELCKIPTDLNSLIELYKQHPNENIGRITRTKLIIATLFNRLTKHIYQRGYLTPKSFRKISDQKDLSNYLECIRKLGEISFQTLQEDNITVKVKEKQGQFIYKEIKVERKIFEELDLFYVRDSDYYSILEPQHTLNIEFLSACYLFSHPEKWESILELNKDRQLVIISFIAGLHSDDYFTEDFVEYVLNITSHSLEQFFRWLYDVEDVRKSLPIGGDGYKCWFGLMETQKLSPSFFLLDYISHEIEIPETYIPTTIVCYCYDYPSPYSEWYEMDYLKHNFLTNLWDKLNIELFLDKFPQYDFIIKGCMKILGNDQLNRLNKCGNNNRITFRIDKLHIWGVSDVTNNVIDLIKFRDYIAPGCSYNFSNYRIVTPYEPFDKKEKDSPDRGQSMFLNMSEVDLRQVSPQVFADTFSLIPSLSCEDNDRYIPSSHWLNLAQVEDSRNNEIRIWFPQPKNFEHFLNIKTNIIQFICSTRDRLKELLNHIVSNPIIQLNKEIKVFVVKVDFVDWYHYEEVTVSEKTIEDYKNNYSSDDILLNNICVREGKRCSMWWCCEISLPKHQKNVFIDYYDDDVSSLDIANDESNPSSRPSRKRKFFRTF